jgi:hypothetical protein
MATLYPFTPPVGGNFQFQPTLDGAQYNVIITWNLWATRYYVNIYTLQNALVLCIALIGSPDNVDISMTKGYFDSTLVYRVSSGNFEVSP